MSSPAAAEMYKRLRRLALRRSQTGSVSCLICGGNDWEDGALRHCGECPVALAQPAPPASAEAATVTDCDSEPDAGLRAGVEALAAALRGIQRWEHARAFCDSDDLDYAEEMLEQAQQTLALLLVPGPREQSPLPDLTALLRQSPAPAQAEAARRQWRHVKTGGIYTELGRMKHKALGERWVDTVLYRNAAGELFSREVANFEQSFEPCALALLAALGGEG